MATAADWELTEVMEVVTGSVYLGHDDVIEMDVELTDEQTIIAELHSCRHQMQVTPPTQDETFHGVPVETPQVDYSDFLYLILDTNVLLSHLKFLKELKDHSIKGIGRPVLIIPWIVIQELDNLKNSPGGLGQQAVSAGKFLSESLSSRHPRIRGQTIEEVNTEIHNLAISNNDDRILHCCMVYQYKIRQQSDGGQGVVILFSNDVMLCNKARINNIIACNRKTLMKELKTILGQKEERGGGGEGHVSSYTQTSEYSMKIEKQLEQDRNDKLLDDCYCEAKIHTKDALSVIIDKEMNEVYGDLSSTILARQPPWSLEDTLYLLKRHWIAVFNYTFGHSSLKIKKMIETLQEQSQSYVLTTDNVLSFINTSLCVLEHFNSHHYNTTPAANQRTSQIWSSISLSVASLKVLRDKISDKPPPLISTPPATTPTLQAPPTPVTPTNTFEILRQVFSLIKESIINGILSTRGALVNGTYSQESNLKLIELLRSLQELIMGIECLIREGLSRQLIHSVHQSISHYISTIIITDNTNSTLISEFNGHVTSQVLFELCQLEQEAGVMFHEALNFMMDGQNQLLQLLQQGTQLLTAAMLV